jgi:hypothetical protein
MSKCTKCDDTGWDNQNNRCKCDLWKICPQCQCFTYVTRLGACRDCLAPRAWYDLDYNDMPYALNDPHHGIEEKLWATEDIIWDSETGEYIDTRINEPYISSDDEDKII